MNVDPVIHDGDLDAALVQRLGQLAQDPHGTAEEPCCADCEERREEVNVPTDTRPVLVAGVARSGTTWVSRSLAHTAGAVYVHEPDNPAHSLYSHRAKRGRGRYPYLRPGDDADRLARCFDTAFGGGRPPPRRQGLAKRLFKDVKPAYRERALDPDRGRRSPRLAAAYALATPRGPRPEAIPIVKSVHASLCLEWITSRWDTRLIVIRRHPLEVVSSWIEMGVGAFLHDDDHHIAAAAPDVVEHYGVKPRFDDGPVARVAWTVGLLMSALDDAARAEPNAEIVDHETLCRDPLGELRWLTRIVGLTWTSRATDWVVESNAGGKGERLKRVAAEQSGRWRSRLDPERLTVARGVLSEFRLAERYPDILQ